MLGRVIHFWDEVRHAFVAGALFLEQVPDCGNVVLTRRTARYLASMVTGKIDRSGRGVTL